MTATNQITLYFMLTTSATDWLIFHQVGFLTSLNNYVASCGYVCELTVHRTTWPYTNWGWLLAMESKYCLGDLGLGPAPLLCAFFRGSCSIWDALAWETVQMAWRSCLCSCWPRLSVPPIPRPSTNRVILSVSFCFSPFYATVFPSTEPTHV